MEFFQAGVALTYRCRRPLHLACFETPQKRNCETGFEGMLSVRFVLVRVTRQGAYGTSHRVALERTASNGIRIGSSSNTPDVRMGPKRGFARGFVSRGGNRRSNWREKRSGAS